MLNPNIKSTQTESIRGSQLRRWAISAFGAVVFLAGLSLTACGGSEDEIINNNNPTCLNCTASCKADSDCEELLNCAKKLHGRRVPRLV